MRQVPRGIRIPWVVLSWAIAIFWIYGLFFTEGHQTLIDWKSLKPDFVELPIRNLESEIGMLLMLANGVVACIVTYWFGWDAEWLQD